MLNWLSIATAPTADTPGFAVLLRGERQSYLFGRVSEGTQRAMTQRQLPLVNVGNMFLSGPIGADSAGGLIGTVLTVADAITGQKKTLSDMVEQRKATGKFVEDKNYYSEILDAVNLHGGRNLTHYLATARHFVFRHGIPINAVELRDDRRGDAAAQETLDETPDWEDESIRVWKVPVTAAPPPPSRKRSHEDMEKDTKSAAATATAEGASPTTPQPDADFAAVQAVVRHMFNSNWSRDMLVEDTLGTVSLPAELFVRDADGAVRKYDGPLPGQEGCDAATRVWVREPWPGAKISNLPDTTPSQTSMCYVVAFHPRRGRFNAALAKELGAIGKQNGMLCGGQSVEINGKVITPEMVLDPPNKGTGFALIDLPDESYVDAFLARPEWRSEGEGGIMDTVKLMLWTLGRGVIDVPGVQKFMRDRPDVHHIVASPEVCPNYPAMDSQARALARFNQMDSVRFPIVESSLVAEKPPPPGAPYEAALVGKNIKLLPRFETVDDEVVDFYTAASARGRGVYQRSYELARDAARTVNSNAFLDELQALEADIPNVDMEVTTLGTGSSVPSKYRNVSGTLLRVPGYGSYLLDCGEGTLGQMRRAFGSAETDEVLRQLRCIVVSHPHADHHLGCASVIRAWAAATRQTAPESTLLICCGPDMARHFEEYALVEDIALARLRFTGEMDWVEGHARGVTEKRYRRGDGAAAGLSRVVRVTVPHCKHSYATVLEWPSGLRVAYSGDCRPSDKFAEAARGCTLLIHEATLDDEHQADAVSKKHSTMSEALRVARDMQARRVVLTHFSQRFAKMPNMEAPVAVPREGASKDGADGAAAAAASKDKQIVLMAWDLMRVKLGQFRHADAFSAAIRENFKRMMIDEDVEKENGKRAAAEEAAARSRFKEEKRLKREEGQREEGAGKKGGKRGGGGRRKGGGGTGDGRGEGDGEAETAGGAE
jgi:ribonuclease Z